VRHFFVLIAIASLMVPAPAQTLLADTKSPSTVTQPALPEVTDELRGDIYMARKMYREAAERYAAIRPITALLENKIGIAYQQMQLFREAEKAYKRASKLDRKYAQAVNNLGTVYYAQKNYRKATRQYEKALELTPNNASFLSNLGMAWFARKKYDRATDLISKAISIDPNVIENRGTTGTTLQDRSVEERARFHYYLAKTYAKQGRNELALLYIRKSIEEGFLERQHFVDDPEFAMLQQLPEFKELIALEPRVL
jgi:tetratricopeptide (TPR) repeat protein